MIVGIGIDTVNMSRFAKVYERHGGDLERRLMGGRERDELPDEDAPRCRRLALAFAAKEAFAKAAGTGLRYPVSLHQIELHRAKLGKPYYLLGEKLSAELARRKILRSHLSLSDDDGCAVAMAVLEGEGK